MRIMMRCVMRSVTMRLGIVDVTGVLSTDISIVHPGT